MKLERLFHVGSPEIIIVGFMEINEIGEARFHGNKKCYLVLK